MNANSVYLERLRNVGFIPLVNGAAPELVVRMARALAAGGIPAAAVPAGLPHCLESVAAIRAELPETLTGLCLSGSASPSEQALAESGAEFIVSPFFDSRLAAWGKRAGIPVVPGAADPQGAADIHAAGCDALALYPAASLGGPSLAAVLSRLWPETAFIPWGGIDTEEAASYLVHPTTPAIVVDWFSGMAVENDDDAEQVAMVAEQAVLSCIGFSFAHMGINTDGESDAADAAERMAGIFHLPWRRGQKSFFVSDQWEIIMGKGPGEKGHIAIGVWSVERALFYLKNRHGINPLSDTITYRDGVMLAAYIDQEIAGFPIHLLRRSPPR